MVWRSIVVHLDADPRCDARVDVAARRARDRDGRLIGVAPTGWVIGGATRSLLRQMTAPILMSH